MALLGNPLEKHVVLEELCARFGLSVVSQTVELHINNNL